MKDRDRPQILPEFPMLSETEKLKRLLRESREEVKYLLDVNIRANRVIKEKNYELQECYEEINRLRGI